MLNYQISLLLTVDFLVLVAGALVIPYYSVYVEKIGGSILDAGLAAGVFAVVAGLTSIIAGKYSDRIKAKPMAVVAGYVLIGIGFLAYLAVTDVWSLMIVQGLIGLSTAFYQPAYDVIYTHFVGNGRRATTRWALWESANYFSLAVGAVVGGGIVQYLGFTTLFIVMAGLSWLAAIFLYIHLKSLRFE
ncbi:MAG: MFS transporter [Candidatus Saccharibacteria bacterium]|nr:MFS transporter [Candidatus Saccharibacteria bacterium]MCA9339639.1 MFS transporter [Candidatus Saccharibacteria bacterium]